VVLVLPSRASEPQPGSISQIRSKGAWTVCASQLCTFTMVRAGLRNACRLRRRPIGHHIAPKFLTLVCSDPYAASACPGSFCAPLALCAAVPSTGMSACAECSGALLLSSLVSRVWGRGVHSYNLLFRSQLVTILPAVLLRWLGWSTPVRKDGHGYEIPCLGIVCCALSA
jgi:hypothetical protein